MHIFKFVVSLITIELFQNRPITTHRTVLNNLCTLRSNICSKPEIIMIFWNKIIMIFWDGRRVSRVSLEL